MVTVSKHHKYAMGSATLKNGYVLYMRPLYDGKTRGKPFQITNKFKSLVTARKNAYKICQKLSNIIEIHPVYNSKVGSTVETVARTMNGNVRSDSDIGGRFVNSDGSLRKYAQMSKARKYGWE